MSHSFEEIYVFLSLTSRNNRDTVRRKEVVFFHLIFRNLVTEPRGARSRWAAQVHSGGRHGVCADSFLRHRKKRGPRGPRAHHQAQQPAGGREHGPGPCGEGKRLIPRFGALSTALAAGHDVCVNPGPSAGAKGAPSPPGGRGGRGLVPAGCPGESLGGSGTASPSPALSCGPAPHPQQAAAGGLLPLPLPPSSAWVSGESLRPAAPHLGGVPCGHFMAPGGRFDARNSLSGQLQTSLLPDSKM